MPDDTSLAANPPTGLLDLAFAGHHNAWAPTSGWTVALPVLAGPTRDPFWTGFEPVESHGRWRIFRKGGTWRAAGVIARVDRPLAELAEGLYAELFEALAGFAVVRVWNYLPEINAERDGLENYRSFCLGRAQAFERRFGAASAQQMPAASAVGCADRTLALFCLAVNGVPRHWENPEQVPAWAYPPEYGPRPPSFARATTVQVSGESWSFLSGTSAIKGHRTQASGDFAAQANCTFDNLRLMGAQLGFGSAFVVPPHARRHWRVYLRNAADLQPAQALFAAAFPAEAGFATFLRADICRRDLALEIEVTIQAGD